MAFDRKRLVDAIGAAGCDALVVRDPCFWTYLAGFALPGTLARHLDWIGGPRPSFALLTADGNCTLLVDTFSRGLCEQRIGRGVESYEAYRDDPLAVLSRLVRSRCGEHPRLAIDRAALWLWQEAAGGMPFEHRQVDSTLWQVMAHKTDAEVAKIRHACHRLDDAFSALAADPPVHCTEATLHARVVGWCLDHGSHFTHGILNAERNDVMYAGESQLEIVPGDMIRTDYVAYFDGYPGHQSRMLVRGKPSPTQLDRYARLLDVHRTLLERCRPPMTGSDVHALVDTLFSKQGMDYTGKIAGHGIGPWMHQQYPTIAAGSRDPIEPGMVLAIEPYVGSWHLQDIILIGESRNVLLSDRLNISRPLVI
jgi:Xaa-Pro aminopeptidase